MCVDWGWVGVVGRVGRDGRQCEIGCASGRETEVCWRDGCGGVGEGGSDSVREFGSGRQCGAVCGIGVRVGAEKRR